ncbi:MAG: glutaminyl-peptide cyclotransferase [Marinifilaceae bacterium]
MLCYCCCVALLMCGACAGKNKTEGNAQTTVQSAVATTEQINKIKMVSPKVGDTIPFEEMFTVELTYPDTTQPDSVKIFLDGKEQPIETLAGNTLTVRQTGKAGRVSLRAEAYFNGENHATTRRVMVAPTKAPKELSYKVVKTYNHNPKSYTQGLFYHNGKMYEGTGQYGSSELMRVDIPTGKVENALALESRYFGEGITLLDNKIYQLTWQSGKAFVYDVNNFNLLETHNYFTQGWGITTYGKKLLMSDGSNKLYTINPNGFVSERHIEVFDNKGPVANINELEYVDGILWANVWMTDYIVGIDPETGVVRYKVDLSKLLTRAERARLDDQDEVLNGIAFNPETGNFYVTGKHWPKLFEIKIEK